MTANVHRETNKTTLGIKYLWDFSFGVLLIGGAPWSVFALFVVVGDYVQKYTHVVASNTVSLLISAVIFFIAFLVFIVAVAYRFRHRFLPRGFIVAEVCLGFVWAIALLVFYGVVMYSIIG